MRPSPMARFKRSVSVISGHKALASALHGTTRSTTTSFAIRGERYSAAAARRQPLIRMAQVSLTTLFSTFGTRLNRLIEGGRFSITRTGISSTRSSSR